MNQSETDTETIEKHYRVTLDFRMLVRPITPEVCQESFFFKAKCSLEEEPIYRENVERLRRLYKLLLNNPKVLEQYLLYVITQEAGHFAYEGLTEAFDAKDEEDLLLSLFQSMAEEDQRFFEECRELKALSENTELIAAAFKVEWLGAEIGEMNRRMTGDVKRVEIVEKTKLRMIRDFALTQRKLS
jgi:hypothetical protein